MGAAALEQACLEAEAAGLAEDRAAAAKALTVIEQAFSRAQQSRDKNIELQS